MAEPRPSIEKRLEQSFVWIAAGVFCITWLKGFRFPNFWSATHFAFNYSAGFVRRGLVGEIARRLGGDEVFRYETFVVFAFVVFFATAIALAFVIRRALESDPKDWSFRVATLVFASSPGLVFFVHAIGYNDYFGVLLVLTFLLFFSKYRGKYTAFYWVLLVSGLSALIHEGLAIMFGPVLVFAMVCHVYRLSAERTFSGREWGLILAHLAMTTGILLSLSSLISTIGVEDIDRVQRLKAHVIKHADFPIRPEAFDALQRSSKENLFRLMPWYWSVDAHWVPATQSWQSFFPGYVWLLVCGYFAVQRARIEPGRRWLVALLFFVASLAPLSFNFVGWDWGRWNGLSLVASYMTLLTLKLYFPDSRHDTSPRYLLTAGVLLAALGLATTTTLFDGFRTEFFPFTDHQNMLEQLLKDGFQYRPRG